MNERKPGAVVPLRPETLQPYASEGLKFKEPTPFEVRWLLKECELSGSQAADLLGVSSSRTIRKWTGGEATPSYAAWRLLLLHAGLVEEPREKSFAPGAFSLGPV